MILADNAIPPQFHIVADAAYSLHTNIMIPYANKDLLDNQKRYNNIHSSTRMVIECAFGDIKDRRLRLQQYRNICIDSGDITPTHIPPMSGYHVLSVRAAVTKR